MLIDVIIPAFNEEKSIGRVIQHLPTEWVRNIIVANNGSTDSTKTVALEAGAIVVDQKLKGYGNACLKAIEFLKGQLIPPDVVVFLDGDFSDFPEQLSELILPITKESYDLVIGSRVLGKEKKVPCCHSSDLGMHLPAG